MRQISVFLTLFIVAAASASLTAQENVIDLPTNFDDDRGRNIPLTFHLPKSEAARPLVLISHGGGASRHGM